MEEKVGAIKTLLQKTKARNTNIVAWMSKAVTKGDIILAISVAGNGQNTT
jgi:hypothetical protein